MSQGRFWYQAGGARTALVVAMLGAALIVTASPARAGPSGFGTVTLTQSGTSVLFDVVLNDGYRFEESLGGGGALFLFNDSLSGSAITNISATLDGAIVSITGGLSGVTNSSFSAGSAGTFTAAVECSLPFTCEEEFTPLINDLHFTVTNATLAQLEVANDAGNLFFADVIPVTVPEPATLALLGIGVAGLGLSRRERK